MGQQRLRIYVNYAIRIVQALVQRFSIAIVVGCHQWWSADKDPGVVTAVSREDPNSRTSTWSLVEDYTLPVEVKKGLIPWLVATIKSAGRRYSDTSNTMMKITGTVSHPTQV